MAALPRGNCSVCGREVARRRNGTAREHPVMHHDGRGNCRGSGEPVSTEPADERSWVPFTAARQARPGRRMRAGATSPEHTVLCRGLRDFSHSTITFTDGCYISVAAAKRHRWMVDI